MAVHAARRTRPAVEVVRQGKILLVEERAEDRAHLTATLADEGHAVRECSSCSEAIDLLADESFDIVLVGQGTSARRECELVEWARAADPRLPVVMLVSDPQVPEEYEPVRQEVAEYLPKPVSRLEVAELKQTIRRHMKPRVFILNFEKAAP